jgi:hypothetical protein
MTAHGDRSTRDVIESHLDLRKQGQLSLDIEQNYAADVVLLTCSGEYRGHDGVRACAALLHRRFPHGRYDYRTLMIAGEVAFLEWSGVSAENSVHDGADSFVVRDGRIRYQTIHYRVS